MKVFYLDRSSVKLAAPSASPVTLCAARIFDYRGSASHRIEGNAHLIAEGYQAQGAAGRMGGAPCPVVLVTGPCVLTWERFGRLYDTPAKWRAIYENGQWLVAPDEPEQCAIEIAFS
jgi:hypothetical protein